MFELGNNLREARQRRRIDLVIAEQDAKIRSKYLSALETEDFDILPGPVFVRGFLRTYSRYLGLDPQLFIDEYNARFGRFEELEEQTGHSLGRPGLAQERDRRGRRTMRSVAILSLVGVAVLAYLGLRDEQQQRMPDRSPNVTQPVDAPDPVDEAQPGALGAAADAAAGKTTATATVAPATGASRTSARTTTPAR